MFTVLGYILTAIEDFPQYILDGAITALNFFFSAIGTALNGLIAALPGMPTLPVMPTGEWMAWANWVYPFGVMFSILTACISMYTFYLAIRYVLNLVRADMG